MNKKILLSLLMLSGIRVNAMIKEDSWSVEFSKVESLSDNNRRSKGVFLYKEQKIVMYLHSDELKLTIHLTPKESILPSEYCDVLCKMAKQTIDEVRSGDYGNNLTMQGLKLIESHVSDKVNAWALETLKQGKKRESNSITIPN